MLFMRNGAYPKFYHDVSRLIPRARLIDDELRTLAYGTDASFYRLIPKLVIRVESEEEVIGILKAARAYQIPVTFRAAGTSLSGQAVTDSVLVLITGSWNGLRISSDALAISLQPGVIGGHANRALSPYRRKIGPDPASIDSAMIGGIAANNASGMCCGVSENSYHTLKSMKIVFADGTRLDTAEDAMVIAFLSSHPEMISRLLALRERVVRDEDLGERIRRKFKMKNTTGYSLNALVDFEDPIEIIQHLMIGSEGTLGFMSEITYRTVPDYPFKASALAVFPDLETACLAVAALARLKVSAVELMDRASLRSVEHRTGIPDFLRRLGENATALLMEARSDREESLSEEVEKILSVLRPFPTLEPVSFSQVAADGTKLWNIRKGLFPSVGAMREAGTTVIIEDVCFPVPRLGEAASDLQNLFRRHGYRDAILFGHALEGNLHFVIKQDFNQPAEVVRYEAFMRDLTALVVAKYEGSLKAEHGTGRNMAPFVELEWGREAYDLMKEIKEIFDPDHILNPGVILNPDPRIHVKNLKPLPPADPLVDKCIECGFCEVYCPSRNLTLTPRQRIVIFREMTRLKATREDSGRLWRLAKAFRYEGEQTCAADGVCALTCPVGIDTGKLIRALRAGQHSKWSQSLVAWAARHMETVLSGVRLSLATLDHLHGILGARRLSRWSAWVRRLSGGHLPEWNPYVPQPALFLPGKSEMEDPSKTVVYFPSCLARISGGSRFDPEKGSLPQKVESLLAKAGIKVIYPRGLEGLCCGLVFESKGFCQAGDEKLKELTERLGEATEGRYPVLFDTSPCSYRVKEAGIKGLGPKLYDPVEFAHAVLARRLVFHKNFQTVAVHATCSTRKMESVAQLKAVAEWCSQEVILPDIGCCGFAGDRGLFYPELPASALEALSRSWPEECRHGFSTSIPCEIGLSLHTGILFRSIFDLIDQCSSAKRKGEASHEVLHGASVV